MDGEPGILSEMYKDGRNRGGGRLVERPSRSSISDAVRAASQGRRPGLTADIRAAMVY